MTRKVPPVLDDWNAPIKVIRTEPFPLFHKKQWSLNKDHARSMKLSPKHKSMWLQHRKRYETVALCYVRKGIRNGWMLSYDGIPNTGPFKTKQEAIGWFCRNGR